MIKKLSFVLILFFSSSLAFSSNSPDGFLKNSVVEISDLVSKYKDRFESDEAFLRSKMNSVVMPKLDVKLMSKIVLGKKIWTNMPEDQQESFVEAFKYRMTSTYMKSITAFDETKLEANSLEDLRLACISSAKQPTRARADIQFTGVPEDGDILIITDTLNKSVYFEFDTHSPTSMVSQSIALRINISHPGSASSVASTFINVVNKVSNFVENFFKYFFL